jgi:hypothetical protein
MKKGVHFIPQMCLATVFSASKYEPGCPNSSGVLNVFEDGTVGRDILPPLDRMLRSKAVFYTMKQTLVEPRDDSGTGKSATVKLSSSQMNLTLMVGQTMVRSPSMISAMKAPGGRPRLIAQTRSRGKVSYTEAHNSFGELPPESEADSGNHT